MHTYLKKTTHFSFAFICLLLMSSFSTPCSSLQLISGGGDNEDDDTQVNATKNVTLFKVDAKNTPNEAYMDAIQLIRFLSNQHEVVRTCEVDFLSGDVRVVLKSGKTSKDLFTLADWDSTLDKLQLTYHELDVNGQKVEANYNTDIVNDCLDCGEQKVSTAAQSTIKDADFGGDMINISFGDTNDDEDPSSSGLNTTPSFAAPAQDYTPEQLDSIKKALFGGGLNLKKDGSGE